MERRKRILLVDDDSDILRATSLRLTVAGFETSTALNGMQAVANATGDQPTAIVMDVRMPQKDGLTALDELKQKSDTRQIPVVMLSASLVDREKALDAGASYFLSKPYEGHELIKAVNAAIDQAEEDELPGSTYATPNMKVKYSYD
ncbi:response regulator [Gimesia maris]|uniref:Response regulator PleD n=1 Tax=Gimesia maris TaxID=122 RepID=A0ABX5YPH9_9PLAN|nr:response regulator transcription factor [Gimesia maris]EDL60843.1 two-component response regulator [Gimesia maris DSM 8797]QEG17571.1 Response regulator PleD [Gimesia maris]QGQ29367.1 response regulator [Gimesia maris]|tara:strand:+ start:123348 stop:123785 length:438 start_codon:yes stop_codon:yes gene_type:complete